MAKAIVHCRICKKEFDRNDKSLVEGVDYIKPSNRMYYHKTCYDEYQSSKKDIHAKMDDEVWFNATWDFLRRDLKYDFHFSKVKSQWNNFLKNKMTAKGIYFSLRYFYEIKKGDLTKSENGIGIVSHIYQESGEYWIERESREKGICAAIEQQIMDANNQKTVVVKLQKSQKKKQNAAEALAAIEIEMEDEE